MGDIGLGVWESILDAAVPAVMIGIEAGDCSKKSYLHKDTGGLFDALGKMLNFVLSNAKDDC